MAQRKPLGDMLLESGRITQADVDRTLEYQRRHGRLFGQSLVALGILTREEVDWYLATHFELPVRTRARVFDGPLSPSVI